MPLLLGKQGLDALHLLIKLGIDAAFQALELVCQLVIHFGLLILERRHTVCQRVHLRLQGFNPGGLIGWHLWFMSCLLGGIDLLF